MSRLFFSVLIVLLFLSSPCHSYIRDYSKAEHTWKSASENAYISGKTIFDDGTEVINVFVINFDKRYGCDAVFKIAFLDDYVYGDLVETIPIEGGHLKLYVDNIIIYDGPIVNVVYSNGTEFGASISPESLVKISDGKIITIELVGKMDILFNLYKAKLHIDSAQKSCLND